MRKLLFGMLYCCLPGFLTIVVAQEPDQTEELIQKIEPSLKIVEKQLDEIEADFWKNVRELDPKDFLMTSPLYQSFNHKIVSFVSNCGSLQRVLFNSGVDIQETFPVEKAAIGILSVWKRFPQLHNRMMKRRNPECIESIYLTGQVPGTICNYEALLDDIAVINMELFYIDCWRGERHQPPGWNFYETSRHVGKFGLPWPWPKYCKYLSEDLLITSAGEFFMAVRDLRIIIRNLRREPFPEPVRDDDPYDLICRIEEDLNQIEREFWDNIYKGGTGAAKNNNLSRYEEFRQRLYRLHVNSRTFQTLLRHKKIDMKMFNPVPDALTIYNIGRSRDQELRRQMRRFFNRASPFESDSKKKRIEFTYHFRAYDANARDLLFQLSLQREANGRYGYKSVFTVPRELSTSHPYGIRSYLPYAELVLLNIPERIDEFCASNIAIFQSERREFEAMTKSAKEYFNAVKGLRLSIEHWKKQFAPPEPETTISPDCPTAPDKKEQFASPEPELSNPEELFRMAVSKLRQKRVVDAETCLNQLAKRDYVPAWYLLSHISDHSLRYFSQRPMRLRAGEATELSPEEIWLKKAMEAGYVPAVERWLFINNLHSSGEQEDALHFADRIQAIWRLPEKLARMPVDKRDQWLNTIRKRAGEGDAASQLLLSYCYAADNIIDSSPAQAEEWLRKAVDQNYPEALSLVWGWRPKGTWSTLNENWTDKAIAAGAIPVIAVSALGKSDLPASALAELEDAGKRGDELAMCALVYYYSKREAVYPKQFERWKRELVLFRSFQRLVGYQSHRNWGVHYQKLYTNTLKVLKDEKSFFQ